MKKLLLLFAVSIFVTGVSPVVAQQVIGTFPSMDGGLEGQTVGNLSSGKQFYSMKK